MRATIMLAGASLLLLQGCSGARTLTSAPSGCTPTTSITVEQAPARLVLTPECIDVVEGASVTVSLSPAPPVGTARVKGRGVGWINASNSPDAGRIVLRPPPGSGGGGGGMRKEYKYEIRIEDVGVLDPRIVVQ